MRSTLPIAAALATVVLTAGVAQAAPAISNGLYAGYIAYSGHYTAVSAAWTEPTVSCAAGERSSATFWIGLDGYGTSDLEQIGTAVDCYSGPPAYSAWYEWFPAAGVGIPNTVRPGDRMSSSITANGSDFTMTLTDSTQSWSRSFTNTISGVPLSSAEVVVEPPTVGTGPLPLANFSSVTFSSASVNGAPLGNSTNGKTEIDINGSGPKTSTTSLSGGNQFTTRWLTH
ncbi:G1 family glutamic endopeptidase [Kutzneria sp. NPDC051319]|uniref:G1 family glutamic endopeptidase n=1 Tax=Kutzneria sp. NPDC051319 TaxID=3155047 RepID=UPI00341C98E4